MFRTTAIVALCLIGLMAAPAANACVSQPGGFAFFCWSGIERCTVLLAKAVVAYGSGYAEQTVDDCT